MKVKENNSRNNFKNLLRWVYYISRDDLFKLCFISMFIEGEIETDMEFKERERERERKKERKNNSRSWNKKETCH